MKTLKWKLSFLLSITSVFFISMHVTSIFAVTKSSNKPYAKIVKQVIKPLMTKYHIPGMAVALTINNRIYFYNYGIASKQSKKLVTQQTLFAIGSVTKTFTATLVSYLDIEHKLSLNNDIANYLPQLRKSKLDHVTLLELATHTSGLPLFVSSSIQTKKQFFNFLDHWQPKYPIGSHRIYSNLGIGLLGFAINHESKGDYKELMQQDIFKPLGLDHTYFQVPATEYGNYAEGYTKKGKPYRMPKIVLLPAAYGLKSCTADLIKYVRANLQEEKIPAKLQQAINATHIGYYKTPYLTQDLVWEQYPFPLHLKQLLAGNNASQLNAPAKPIKPPLQPSKDVYINKTGATDSFRSYIAFIPEKQIGIVLLANKAYPFEQRVIAGYKILSGVLQKNSKP